MKADLKPMLIVAGGITIFGLAIWAIKKLPSNAVTNPVKAAASAAQGG